LQNAVCIAALLPSRDAQRRDEVERSHTRALAEKMPTEALICEKQPAEVCFATLSPLNLAKFSASTVIDQGIAEPWQ